jgi:protein gp37
MKNTGISWTTHTFNPWIGCTRVSAGCDYCYAEALNKRTGHTNWGTGAERRVTSDVYWLKPIKWNHIAELTGKRTRVFCASMADVFDGEAPADARERLWKVIRATPFLDWQLLTKRPTNILRLLPADWLAGYTNVWLGVTAENREQAVRRISALRSIPTAIRFVSAEPLLEDLGELDLEGIDWVIIGGESGAGARPFDVTWADHLIERSKLQGVKVFVKQLGRKPFLNGNELVVLNGNGRRDGHGGEPDLWPDVLKPLVLRQFPEVALLARLSA